MSEETFVRELAVRAGEVRPRPLSFEEVQTSAHRIRRNRRLAVSGAAAALVAAALVVPAALGGSSPRSAPEPAPAPPTPSVVPFDLAAEPGPPPAVLYIRIADDVALTPSGEERQLPPGTTQLVPYDGGYLALAAGDNPLPVEQRLYRLDADFEQTDDLGPVVPAVATAPDGRVAWAEVDDDLSTDLTVDGGDSGVSLAPETLAYPVAFDADGLVFRQRSATDEDQGYWRLTSSGVEEVVGLSVVRDASPVTGIVVGDTRYDDRAGQPCAGAVGGDSEPWERCGVEVVALSPDGRSVVGYPDVGTPGHARLTVLDAANGQPVIDFKCAGGSVVQGVAWEDDAHLLAVVVQDGTQAILRLGLDGSVERATDAVVLDAMSVAWFLGGPPAL